MPHCVDTTIAVRDLGALPGQVTVILQVVCITFPIAKSWCVLCNRLRSQIIENRSILEEVRASRDYQSENCGYLIPDTNGSAFTLTPCWKDTRLLYKEQFIVMSFVIAFKHSVIFSSHCFMHFHRFRTLRM